MNPETVPIDDYGLVGDTRSAALISGGGSIDWMCFPRFDSEPVFSRLVAGERGGSFSIAVDGGRVAGRRYLSGTPIIETTYRTDSAVVTLTDGMVLDVRSDLLPQALLVREVVCTGASATVRLRFDPRWGWSRSRIEAARVSGALVCRRRRVVLSLTTTPDIRIRPGDEVRLEMREGDRLVAALGLSDGGPAVIVHPESAAQHLRATSAWWRGWGDTLDLGPFEPGMVARSVLTLRLLTYSPSGAPVAAPTTSLPEVPGGSANWDYRYAWVRDASLGTAAFVGTGKRDEASAFLAWMLHASRLTRPRLHVVYDVLGKTSTLSERTLEDLPGYEGSRPVRVGNAAVDQFQLDVYGWMIDAAWSLVRGGGELTRESRRSMWGHADVIANRWREPDHGIWELRGRRRQFVHSKVMAWVGLDRALRLAKVLGVRDARLTRWGEERERIAADVRTAGFDERRGAYVQAYGERDLDASTLLIPVAGIETGESPRVASTIRAVRRELGAGGPLLYRYPTDREGAFVACSFWLVESLCAGRRYEEAAEIFASTCALATPLGLFAEQMDPSSQRHRGNYPQALSHAALVHASLALRAGAAHG